jgi:hypothetical protein
MSGAKILSGSLTAIATAAAIVAGSLAMTSGADARTHGRHYYGHAFGGAYGYAPAVRVRMYAANHYSPLPRWGRSRVNNNFNPDFQFGGGYGQ